MKTTKARRAQLAYVLDTKGSSTGGDRLARALIADVDDAMGILRDLLTEANEASCDWDYQMLRESVRERCRPFLKEPSDG